MKQLFATIVLVLSTPFLAQAACSVDGATIVFVNGIFTSEEDASQATVRLSNEDFLRTGRTDIATINGYNPSHLGGASDIFQSVTQAFGKPISQHDLKTILMQVHPEVTTQKILLVGHSQGSFYVNEMYEYLILHGVPKESVGVYHVASPASFVAGGGQYVTSKNDKLINWVRDAEINGNLRVYADSHYTIEGAVASALRANVEIPPEPGHEDSDYGGHKFDVYMNGAGDRIIRDIESALSRLKSNVGDTSTEGCFTPPDADIAYKMQAAALSVADPLFGAIAGAASAVKSDVAGFARGLASTRGAGLSLFAGKTKFVPNNVAASQLAAPAITVSDSVEETPPPIQASVTEEQPEPIVETEQPTEQAEGTDPIPQNATDEPPAQESQQLYPNLFPVQPGFGGGGGASAQTDTTSTAAATPADTTPPATTTLSVAECAYSLMSSDCVIPTTSVSLSWSVATDAASYGIAVNDSVESTTTGTSGSATLSGDATSTIAVVSYDAAGNSATSTEVSVRTLSRSLIINEVGWGGTDTVPDQWVEIKNVSAFDLPLDNFVLYNNGSSLATLSGSLPTSALLVVEQTSTPFTGLYKIVTPFTSLATATADELSLVWNGVTLDSTPDSSTCPSWCAGEKDAVLGSNVSGLGDLYSSLSMERISDTADGTLAASWRTTDSYAPYLSGGGKLWGTPGDANSAGLPEEGVYCGGNTNLVVSNSSFNPTGSCVYLSKFVTGYTFGANRAGGLYRGTVSSSTQITGHSMGKSLATITSDAVPADSAAGEDFFFALWENRTFGNDTYDFNFYFTQGASSTLGISGTPHGNYVTIPWTYSP